MNGLFLDLGFVRTGWILADVEKKEIIQYGTIRTDRIRTGEKSKSRSDITKCKHILRCINNALIIYDCKVIAAEIPHGGAQNARAARLMGMVTGGLIGITMDLQIRYYLPSECKHAMIGKKTAKKAQIQAAVKKKYPPLAENLTKGDFEHVADAITVYECYLKGNV